MTQSRFHNTNHVETLGRCSIWVTGLVLIHYNRFIVDNEACLLLSVSTLLAHVGGVWQT